jgi:hypothetical protein
VSFGPPPLAGWRSTLVPGGSTCAADCPTAAIVPGRMSATNRTSQYWPSATSTARGGRFLSRSSGRAGWKGTAFQRTTDAGSMPDSASARLRIVAAAKSTRRAAASPRPALQCVHRRRDPASAQQARGRQSHVRGSIAGAVLRPTAPSVHWRS